MARIAASLRAPADPVNNAAQNRGARALSRAGPACYRPATKPMTAAPPLALDRTRPTIGVVVNPKARRHRRDPEATSRLRSAVGRQGLVREAHDLEELAQIADEFRQARLEVLAIGGGDGTNTTTLTVFARVYGDEPLPAVALLRGGTMNTVANGLGVPRLTPDALLRRLALAARDGETLPTHDNATIDVGGRLGFLFGTGIFRSFLDEYYAAGPDPTPITAASTFTRIASSIAVQGALAKRLMAPIDVQIEADGARWSAGPYLAVAAGTVDQVGLGFRPFHRAFDRADAFHLLALRCTALEALLQLPRIHRGEHLPASLVREGLVRDAVLTSRDASVRYMVDGDLLESSGPLRLRAGPSVRVVGQPPARGV